MVGRAPSAYFAFWAHFDNRSRTWRDGGPKLDLLDEMTPAQRRRTEHELLHRLARAPETDGWVLDALGALRSEEAIPMLRELVRGPVAEDAAIALWRISRWRGAVRVLDRVIRAQRDSASGRRPSLLRRLDAARYLAEIGSPRARAALLEVAADHEAPLRLQRTIEGLLR
jgi:HEAT repeat protein